MSKIPRPQDKRAALQDSGGLREVSSSDENALSHNWVERAHMTIMGKPLVLHACTKCSIVKEFSSSEFWAKCWGEPSRAPKAAQDALKSMPDHKPDGSGLDDGPYLPGQAPRKPYSISAEKSKTARRQAWKTRRNLYGQKGHK